MAQEVEETLSQSLLHGAIISSPDQLTDSPAPKKPRTDGNSNRTKSKYRLKPEDFKFVRNLAIPIQHRIARKTSLQKQTRNLQKAVDDKDPPGFLKPKVRCPIAPQGLSLDPGIETLWGKVLAEAGRKLTILSLRQAEKWQQQNEATLQQEKSEAVHQIKAHLLATKDIKTGRTVLSHFLRERPSRKRKRVH